MKRLILYLFLLVLTGCKWADPAPKLLKICTNPTGISAKINTNNQIEYSIEGLTNDIATITWRITNSAGLSSTLGITTSSGIIALQGIDVVKIDAVVTNVCGTTLPTFSSTISPSYTSWASGGTGNDNANSIATDNNGSIYVVGEFMGTISFFDSNKNLIANRLSIGSKDVYLAKYNNDGLFQWVSRIGSIGEDIGNDVTVDNNGNVYVTGSFNGTLNFSNAGQTTTNTLTSIGAQDIFLAKYTANGNIVWAAKGGGNSNDYGNGVAVDNFDNVYITGNYEGSDISFYQANSQAKTSFFTSSNGFDIFTTKFDASGNFQWFKSENSPQSSLAADVGNGITTDNTGIYITGLSWGRAAGNTGTNDFFAIKYSLEGSKLWEKSYGGVGNDVGTSIIADNLGALYITGLYQSTIPSLGLNAVGGTDAFIVKIKSADGALDWAKSAGGSGDEIGEDITVDKDGIVYSIGRYTNTISQPISVKNNGKTDIFLSKYNRNGNLIGIDGIGGVGDEIGKSIVVTKIGNKLFGAGRFDASFYVGTNVLGNFGGTDAFIFQLGFK